MRKQLARQTLYLSIFHLFGGISGCISILIYVNFPLSDASTFYLAAALSVYITGLASGILLFKKKYKLGLLVGQIYQLAQVPIVGTYYLSYMIHSIFALGFFWGATDLEFFFELSNGFTIGLFDEAFEGRFGLNIFALVMFFVVRHLADLHQESNTS